MVSHGGQQGKLYQVPSANSCSWLVEDMRESNTTLDYFVKEQLGKCTAHSKTVNTFQEYDFQMQVSIPLSHL